MCLVIDRTDRVPFNSNVTVSLVRYLVKPEVRLPVFVLVIAA
jgi:Na+-translocating ferredoxin:NAD+ oxidoreductase RnfE subunit